MGRKESRVRTGIVEEVYTKIEEEEDDDGDVNKTER